MLREKQMTWWLDGKQYSKSFYIFIDSVNLTLISEDIKRPCDKYSQLERPGTFIKSWDHQDPFQ